MSEHETVILRGMRAGARVMVLAAGLAVAGCGSEADPIAPVPPSAPPVSSPDPSSLLPSAADPPTSGPSAAGPAAAGSSGSSAQPSTVVAVPKGDGGSYPSPDAVIAALAEGGLPCAEPMAGDYPGVAQAKGCILDGTEDAVVLRFADAAERQAYLADKRDLTSVVVGRDWAVQTVLRPSAEKVAAALGGEVR